MILNLWLFSLVTSSNFIFTFRYCSNSVLHTFPALAPYGYSVNLSKVCNLLSSLLLSAIFLISSVCSLCSSTLNLCCDYNVISLFSKQFYNHSTEVFVLLCTFLFLWLSYLHCHHLLNKK